MKAGFGDSLWGLMFGKKSTHTRPLFSEVRVLYPPFPTYVAMTYWPYRFIKRWDTQTNQLYNLDNDPLETTNIYREDDKLSRYLEGILFSWVDGGQSPAGRLVLAQ